MDYEHQYITMFCCRWLKQTLRKHCILIIMLIIQLLENWQIMN